MSVERCRRRLLVIVVCNYYYYCSIIPRAFCLTCMVNWGMVVLAVNIVFSPPVNPWLWPQNVFGLDFVTIIIRISLGLCTLNTIVVEFRWTEWIEWLIELLTVAMKRMMWMDLLLYNNIKAESEWGCLQKPKRSFYFVFIYGEYFDTCSENLEPCSGRGLNGIFNAN